MDNSEIKIFDDDPVLIEELKQYAKSINYRDLLIRPLGPELTKIFEKNRNNYASKNFLKGIEYEYGANNKKIDFKKAFSIYKEYSEKNDFYCLYKMHIIYLLEYEKFGVQQNRILERFYLLKCLAYAPISLFDNNFLIFYKIDLLDEVLNCVNIEDPYFEKHYELFQYLFQKKEEFNLQENEISLILIISLLCISNDEEDQIRYLKELKEITFNKEKGDVYYEGMSKGIFFQQNNNLTEEIFLKSEISEFYNKIIENKQYQYYYDYSKELLKNNDGLYNYDILEILKQSLNYEMDINRLKYYTALLNLFYNNDNFSKFLTDYNIASTLLNCLLDLLVCNYLALTEFIFLYGFLKEKSKFPEKISSDYMKYVKEIYNFIYFLSHEKMKEFKEKTFENIIPCERIMGFIYYFSIFKRDIIKANEFFKKSLESNNNTFSSENYIDIFFLLKGKEILKQNNKKIEEKSPTEVFNLCKIFSENGIDRNCFGLYFFGKLFYDGIGYEKEKPLALKIFNEVKRLNSFNSFLEIYCRNEAIKILNSENINNIEEIKIISKFKDDICCICYDNKPNSIICPCKHVFCDSCVNHFEKEEKCPICRGAIIFVTNLE